MNLQLVRISQSELTHLNKRGLGFVIGQTPVARCVNILSPVGPLGVASVCNAGVYSGSGYADTDGTPWRAYYCRRCAVSLGAVS